MKILLEKAIDSKKFILVQNSILDEQVEAIVNPANQQLLHGGGVAGLISRAGGPQIQKESNKKAPVETGESTFTTAGNLSFKAIIHTVGPIWKGGYKNEPEHLKSAVRSALKTAEDLDIKSISLPAISTGIFGYPLEPAISIIFRTITEYLKESSTLEEIHLCEFSKEKAEEIKQIIQNLV